MAADSTTVNLSWLLAELDGLIDALDEQTLDVQDELAQINPAYRASALNLLHYLVLRGRDIRPLQAALAELGLSSLGRSEAGVLQSVRQVRDLVATLAAVEPRSSVEPRIAISSAEGGELLRSHAVALLGSAPENRDVRVMVTMPSDAADRPELVRAMLEAGMDCMRINCAHDGPEAWSAMIANLRRAMTELDRPCRIMMDLAGPKLRTGPVMPGPRVLKIRPTRDEYGRVARPARLWLGSGSAPAPTPAGERGSGAIQAPAEWLATLTSGDTLHFRDARDARRSLTIVETFVEGCWAECAATAYLTPDTVLVREGDSDEQGAPIDGVPARAQFIELFQGDTLILTRDLAPGTPATRDGSGAAVEPARIGCTLPEVFAGARHGEPIWFDDGKIGGEIVAVSPDQIAVTIVQARPGGARLRAEKGINLPESDLRVPALTDKDRVDLQFVARHADLVGYSFISEPKDVMVLQEALRRLDAPAVGIVLKIETRRAFEQLPGLLLAAMRGPSAGLMIARGDLAIECGFERLAEVQEETLWISESAHIPVIWATQVLETLAQTGLPSRSEITDAAMGQRAECVMLNKGPFVVDAIRLLDGILERMQEHQSKKRSLMRRLRAWSIDPSELAASPEQAGLVPSA